MPTVYEARQTVYAAVLAAPRGDGSFSPDRVDEAIRCIGEDFANITRCIRGTTNVTLTTSTSTADFTATSGMDRFLEHNFISARIGTAPVKYCPNIESVLRSSATSGQPTRLAFEGKNTAVFNRTMAAGYTLKVFWWQPFTTWTVGIGDTAAAAISLNLPDQYLRTILRTGAVATMVYGDPRSLYASQGYAEYKAFRDRIAADYQPTLRYQPATDVPMYQQPQAPAVAAA